MTTNQKLIPVLLLIIGLVLGFTAGNMFGEGGVVDNTVVIKARLAEMGIVPLAQVEEVREIQGVIRAFDGSTITVALSSPRDPFGDPALDERLVAVDDNTKITFVVVKDEDVFKREIALYQKTMSALKPDITKNPNDLPPPPQMSEKKNGDIAAIEIGKTVIITATENIKEQRSFTAATVDVTPSAPVPPVPASEVDATPATSSPPPPPPVAPRSTDGNVGPSSPPPAPPVGSVTIVPPPPPIETAQ